MSAEHHEHILPIKVYLRVAAALLALTGATVAISYVHLGPWNAVVAVGIASLKASLVALFFMHLKYDNKINMFIFFAAILFVTLFITLTMFDTLRRADIYEIRGEPIKKNAIIYEKPASSPDNRRNNNEARH